MAGFPSVGAGGASLLLGGVVVLLSVCCCICFFTSCVLVGSGGLNITVRVCPRRCDGAAAILDKLYLWRYIWEADSWRPRHPRARSENTCAGVAVLCVVVVGLGLDLGVGVGVDVGVVVGGGGDFVVC